jgi:pyruvate kinase
MGAPMRRTKIIATIGPACDAPGVLLRVLSAGADVARLNGSHGTRDDLERRLAAVRTAADQLDRVVAVMLDLPGPKLRVGEVAGGTALTEDSVFRLLARECEGDATHACISHAELGRDVRTGDRIMIDDGAIELTVTSAAPGEVVTRVVRGGPLTSHKGVNVPGRRLSIASVTPMDIDLLEWGLEAGVDLIAQSFVRDCDDIRILRDAMGDRRVPLIAKIEKHEALEDLDEIIASADAIMVARGDLAVETSPEAVPPAQRRIVRGCRAMGRPVIVATQMLESMTSAPRPTRAEASDVATAVFEGADAVMLSAETAVGEFPVEAVATMDSVCRAAEEVGSDVGAPRPSGSMTTAVAAAACDLASDVGAAAIITATESGTTARSVAACRPPVPVLAVTPIRSVARALALVWGVTPSVIEAGASIEDTTASAMSVARSSGLVQPGERVVLTAGTAVGVSGLTDLIRVLTV